MRRKISLSVKWPEKLRLIPRYQLGQLFIRDGKTRTPSLGIRQQRHGAVMACGAVMILPPFPGIAIQKFQAA